MNEVTQLRQRAELCRDAAEKLTSKVHSQPMAPAVQRKLLDQAAIFAKRADKFTFRATKLANQLNRVPC